MRTEILSADVESGDRPLPRKLHWQKWRFPSSRLGLAFAFRPSPKARSSSLATSLRFFSLPVNKGFTPQSFSRRGNTPGKAHPRADAWAVRRVGSGNGTGVETGSIDTSVKL